MPVLKRLVLITGLLVLVLTLLFVVAGRAIVLAHIRTLDSQVASRAGLQAADRLRLEVDRFEEEAAAWARSDAVRLYAAGELPAFPDQYVSNAATAPYALNLVIVLDAAGRPLLRAAFDLGLDAGAALTDEIDALHAAGDPLLQPWRADENLAHAGIVMLPDGPLLVARAPIAAPGDTARGTVVWGRYLDAPALDALLAPTRDRAAIYRSDSPLLPPALAGIAYRPEGFSQLVLPAAGDRLGAYVPIVDVYGRPTVYLEVVPAESARAAFRAALVPGVLAALALGLAAVAALVVAVQRLCIAPIQARQVTVVAYESSAPAARVPAEPPDPSRFWTSPQP